MSNIWKKMSDEQRREILQYVILVPLLQDLHRDAFIFDYSRADDDKTLEESQLSLLKYHFRKRSYALLTDPCVFIWEGFKNQIHPVTTDAFYEKGFCKEKVERFKSDIRFLRIGQRDFYIATESVLNALDIDVSNAPDFEGFPEPEERAPAAEGNDTLAGGPGGMQ